MVLLPDILLENRYRIISILGQGGMGSVYRAIDEHLGVSVAVKENLFLSDEYARQFQRETNILANVRHQALPRVVDYFSIPGKGQYLIMEYIAGEDLRQRIERAVTIPEREVILIGIIICNALTYLHTRPSTIVHRDIKPGNIKITSDGEVVLVDFGLAKVIHRAQADATTSGARALTPGYSPPEQYGTARTDSRSDIYSLGATLYAALSGTIPEDGLARVTGKEKLTPLRHLSSGVSRKIAAVIERALEIEPDDRFQTAREFKISLLEASELSLSGVENLSISPPPTGEKLEFSMPLEGEMSEDAIKSRQENIIRWRRNIKRWWLGYRMITVPLIILGLLSFLLFFNPSGWPLSAMGLHYESTQTRLNQAVDTPENRFVTTPSALFVIKKSPTQVTVQKPSASEILTSTKSTGISGGVGKISFVSDRTGKFQVWMMNFDGSEQRQVTNLPDGACQPTWSPDGKKMAIISPCKEKTLIYPEAKIYILNSDGSSPFPLMVSSGGDFDPVWSPNGEKIAFTSIRNEIAHIFVYNFETASIEELSDTRYQDLHPTWSPSGRQLAFARRGSFNYHIWIMGDEGLTQMQFSASGNVDDYWPVWSPNGEFVVFSRSGPQPSVPYLYYLTYNDRNSGAEKLLTAKEKMEPDPGYSLDISRDNKWLAFESWPDGRNHDIYKMDIEGNGFTRLTNDPGFDFDPVWMPNLNP